MKIKEIEHFKQRWEADRLASTEESQEFYCDRLCDECETSPDDPIMERDLLEAFYWGGSPQGLLYWESVYIGSDTSRLVPDILPIECKVWDDEHANDVDSDGDYIEDYLPVLAHISDWGFLTETYFWDNAIPMCIIESDRRNAK